MSHMPAESHRSKKQVKHIRSRKKNLFQHPLLAKLNYMQAGRRKTFIRYSISVISRVINGKFGAERQ